MHSDNPDWPVTMRMENISSLWAMSESMNYHSVFDIDFLIKTFVFSLGFSNRMASAPVALWDRKVSQSCILQNPADVHVLYCQ